MTRYTRAKGSKASNERTPNDATPWHLMKQQLAENLSKPEESSERKSAKELLKDSNATGPENNDWAEFNETSTKKDNIVTKVKKKKKQKTPLKNENESSDKVEVCNKDEEQTSNIKAEKKSLKRNIDDDSNSTTEIKTKKKKQNEYQNESGKNTSMIMQSRGGLSKRQKRNIRKREKNFIERTVNNNNTRQSKIRSDKEYKRRKEDFGPKEIMLNGVRVEIANFDGFPVTKEDAERLRDLKQKMIMKGIPKKDLDIAMKLERRRAERTFARMRRSVCFHCRKGGHNLSDCPELASEQVGTGICFKCGSTEHTHFECKVSKPTEFRYATCFICREQGHIAKQCPDNPKGVYPKGGSCKICGDVTHLKKDCPDLIKEKEESTITVNTITNDNVESLDGNEVTVSQKSDKKSKKIVKF